MQCDYIYISLDRCTRSATHYAQTRYDAPDTPVCEHLMCKMHIPNAHGFVRPLDELFHRAYAHGEMDGAFAPLDEEAMWSWANGTTGALPKDPRMSGTSTEALEHRVSALGFDPNVDLEAQDTWFSLAMHLGFGRALMERFENLALV